MITTSHYTEAVWLNSTDICSLSHIVEVSGLSRQDVLDLVETGVLRPSNEDPTNYFFHASCIAVARRARRIRDDFELDTDAWTLAMRLLHRIDELEAEIRRLRGPAGRR